MIQEVVENAGLEGFAEIGLIAFVIAFLLVLIRVFFMSDEDARAQSEIPFTDGEKPETDS